MVKRTVLPLAALVSLLCVSAAAARTTRPGIALGHRIGSVSFAEPRSQVTKALGRGVATSIDDHHVRFYRRAGIYVDYAASGLQQAAAIVLTRSPGYKTRSGVGVGSSLHQLRSRVGVTCNGSPASQCQHQGTNVNRPLTVFNIDPTTKRVVEVALAPGGD
jgi:hypothetical protein